MIDSLDDLEVRAVRQHVRWCHRNGVIFEQPSTIDVTDDSVILTNARGVIAEFVIIMRGRAVRLRRVRSLPDA